MRRHRKIRSSRARPIEPLERRLLLAVTFSPAIDFAVGKGARAVATGDFNGDSYTDLAVANNGANNISILLGDGAGNFAAAKNYAAHDGPYAIAVADLNGDSKLDLAVANSRSNDVSVLAGNGNGTFTSPANYFGNDGAIAVAVADFNNNTKPDIAVANSRSRDVSVFMGSTFGAPTNFVAANTPMGIVAADFNGDAKIDLAIANRDSNSVSFLKGNGAGGFAAAAEFPAGNQPMGLVAVDLNNDSKLDLAVVNYGNAAGTDLGGVNVLLGNGSGSFSSPTKFPAGIRPQAVAAGDFNGDANADLAVANYGPADGTGSVSILLGSGDGKFAAPVNVAAGDRPVHVAVGDFDGDTKADLAVATFYTGSTIGKVSVLINNDESQWAFDPARPMWGRVPWSVPGTIEAENFDVGGEGTSYHDTTPQNLGGHYRSTGVDVYSGASNAYVGSTAAGEWLEYTVNVPLAGTFPLQVRLAAQGGGGSFHLELDGKNITGPIAIPDTGDYGNYTTLTKTVAFPAGKHVLRLAMDSKSTGGYVASFDWINFAPTTGGISGTVYNDLNGNGVKDGSETGLKDWQVYIDDNNNGRRDADEKLTLTNSSGAYSFNGLAAGTYVVRQVIQSPFRRTSTLSHSVTIATAQIAADKNFGNTRNVLISGYVFNDANKNGLKESSEAGLQSFRVYIDSNLNGTYDNGEPSKSTDASGYYQFQAVPAGTGTLRVQLQTGYATTAPLTGAYSGTLTTGQIVGNVNFGLRFFPSPMPLTSGQNLKFQSRVTLNWWDELEIAVNEIG